MPFLSCHIMFRLIFVYVMFYFSMEIGINGYYNEHLEGIQNPVMAR